MKKQLFWSTLNIAALFMLLPTNTMKAAAENNNNHQLKSSLALAVEFNSIESAKNALAKGAPVNICGCHENNGPILIIATIRRNINMITLLLEHGANVNIKDEDGGTALHIALKYKELEIAQLLINAKADCTIADNDGFTPLHEAAKIRIIDQSKLEKIITQLIAQKADINARIWDNSTPLALAANNENNATVYHLIVAEANIPLKNTPKAIKILAPLLAQYKNIMHQKLTMHLADDLASIVLEYITYPTL